MTATVAARRPSVGAEVVPIHDECHASRFIKGSNVRKPPNQDQEGLIGLMMHPLNILLVAFPAGIGSYYMSWGASWTFWLNFVALIPLAKILGDATEELAAGLKNDMLAGLLNATMGNAVEMVITVNTLRAGLIGVVKATLLGSVLSNLLLVLGMSFFCGGIVSTASPPPPGNLRASRIQQIGGEGSYTAIPVAKEAKDGTGSSPQFVGEKVQTFSVMSALVDTSMLLLSCLSFSLVTVFYDQEHVEDRAHMNQVLLPVSRLCSMIIMLAYVAYIFFQLVTHRKAMQGDEDEEDDKEEATLSIPMAIFVMCLSTVVVSFSSEMLVESLDDVVAEAGMSQHFIGIILLPIVGNACEHASAVRFAIQDKPGLSIGIAVGSSTQISLFVVPFSVLIGWMIDQPMELNFGSLNVTVMSITVVVMLSVVVDGSANWLQGFLLVCAYLIVSVLYWYCPNGMPENV